MVLRELREWQAQKAQVVYLLNMEIIWNNGDFSVIDFEI